MFEANGTSALIADAAVTPAPPDMGSLDSRLAAALAAEPTASDALAKLIKEFEAAAVAIDRIIAEARERSLDPACTDPAAAQKTLQSATLRCNRIDAALPRLAAHHDQARAREYATEWSKEFERLAEERDGLARELTKTYPAAVKKLVNLFERIEEFDREIAQLHSAAPRSDHLRLLGVELTARCLDSFTAVQPSIARELKLPHPGQSSHLAWPPAQVNFSVLAAQQVADIMAQRSAAYSSDWAAAHALENERRREDLARLQAFGERERKAKKAAYHTALRAADEFRRTGHKETTHG